MTLCWVLRRRGKYACQREDWVLVTAKAAAHGSLFDDAERRCVVTLI
jgi:hypothetical protein